MIFSFSFFIGSFFTLNVYTSSSLETKVFFSRLRYIGFALMCPAALLFFTAILKKHDWLHQKWIKIALFIPTVITILFSVGVFPAELLTHSYASFSQWGVSVTSFESGPAFYIHFIWSYSLTLLIIMLLFHTAITDKEKRKYAIIFLSGILIGTFIDVYNVITNSPLRWLMVSAGTFAISELSIFYVTSKTGLFGLISTNQSNTELAEKLDFQKHLLTLLSHDLSGNIHQQTMLSNFLLDKNLDEDSNELASMLANSSQSSKDLLTNLITWVKTQDSQKFTINLTNLNAFEIIEKAIAIVKTSHPHKKLNILQDENNKKVFIKADIEMFSSIIRNLISNAINASEAEINITVKASDDASFSTIIIQDNGSGIAPEELLRLQEKKKIKGSGHGYGLGLTLVRHLIELHQGQFDIQSTKHVGTTVTFTMPK